MNNATRVSLAWRRWLVDGVFQRFAWFESGYLGSLDFNGFASLGVSSGAGSPICNLECAESDEGHGLFLLQTGGNGLQGAIDCTGGRCFGEVGGFGNCLDEILLIHESPLS